MYYAENHRKKSNFVKEISKLTTAATKALQESLTSRTLPSELHNIKLYEFLPRATAKQALM